MNKEPTVRSIPGKWVEDSYQNKQRMTEELLEETEAALLRNSTSFYYKGFAYYVQPDHNERFHRERNSVSSSNTNLSAMGKQVVPN